MNLHLVDDEKVINRMIASFEEALPGRNIYICFKKKGDLVHVNPLNPNLYLYESEGDFDASLLRNVSRVVFHFLSLEKINFFKQYIKHRVLTYWIAWGGDLYNGLLAPRGFSIYYEKKFLGKRGQLMLQLGKLGIFSLKSARILDFIKNSIDFIISSDYPLMIKYLKPYITAKRLTGFFYYPIDQVLGSLVDEKSCGENIIIGNSASLSNNHLYAFNFLSNINLGQRKIIVPLNYNGDDRYKKHVIDVGLKMFKSEFSPLRNFLPLVEYNKLFLSSGYCIYANWRQEAMGNILIALYLGCKVFLSNKSPLLMRFKEMGVNVFELELIDENSFVRLSAEEIEHNRKILSFRYSKEQQIKKIQELFNF